MKTFEKIGLIGRSRHGGSALTMQRLMQLLKRRGQEVLVEKRLVKLLDNGGARVSDRDEIGKTCDLAIVVGGDGSMLSAARDMSQHNTPVLGVNRGRLGFLTDISPDEIESKVAAVLDGEYEEEERFLLEVVVTRDGKETGRADAFNDVVVNSGTSARMIEFDLHIDDSFVYRQRSDGLIVATPTGSTAYSLSGGGPIMHPALDAIVLVPMFPQTLSSRPIAVGGNSRIRIEIVTSDRIRPSVTCDGQVNMKVRPGDLVEVYKKAYRLRLIHPLDHDFYASCRDKLHWSMALVE
ncbi:MAG: NAD(+) kinase [Halieaceae bacterium]|nr:NAD(+) kinase [Halieaceae bacterium]